MAVAAQQSANAHAAATASVLKQVEAIEDSTDMIRAARNGTEAQTAAAIAYKNAIRSGADSTAAVALSSATFASYMERAAAAAQQAADAVNSANYSRYLSASGAKGMVAGGNDGGYASTSGTFEPDPNNTTKVGNTALSGVGYELYLQSQNIQASQRDVSIDDIVTKSAGDIGSALISLLGTSPYSPTQHRTGLESMGVAGTFEDLGVKYGTAPSQSDLSSGIGSLYDLKVSQAGSIDDKRSILQEEIAYFQAQPQTIANIQKIVSLQQSIDQLKEATDANTAATSATLNPLYTQGHGALAIGYYKAAGGLDMIAQGPSSGDRVPFNAMVNGGERITITPPGQDTSRQTTIIQNFYGSSNDNRRRSVRQAYQGFAQSMAAVG